MTLTITIHCQEKCFLFDLSLLGLMLKHLPTVQKQAFSKPRERLMSMLLWNPELERSTFNKNNNKNTKFVHFKIARLNSASLKKISNI